MRNTIIAALSVILMGSLAQATPVENGAAFTGNYQIVDTNCYIPVFNYSTNQNDLISKVSFKGTPEGLEAPIQSGSGASGSSLIPISEPKTVTPADGISFTTQAEYVSDKEFYNYFSLTESGATKITTVDYLLDAYGKTITETTNVYTNPCAAPTTTTVCHYQKIDSN
jgi:hypothetical protein